VETDEVGIPTKPTWSVHELLSSYPRPTISPQTLKKLLDLSALIPPVEGTPEHAKLTREMEEMVRLVEAVKLVDTSEVKLAEGEVVPDGRIWPQGEGIRLGQRTDEVEFGGEEDSENGRTLLSHATKVVNGSYVVEHDRRRK